MNSSFFDLIVQVSGKHDRYIERVRLGSDGISIGRAWNSDIIIQDKYVDAEQLKIHLDEQGALSIEDLSSTNRSLLADKPFTNSVQSYHWGDEIHIGDTRLRIFDTSSEVAQTANRSAWYSLLEPFQSGHAAALIGVIAALLYTFNFWAFSVKPFVFFDFVVRFVTVIVTLFAWTLIVGSISKLVRGQANMREHWVLACLAAIVIVVIGFLVSMVRFNIQSPDVGQWLSSVTYAGIGIAFIYALLTYSSHLGSRAKWFWSLLLVGGMVANIYSDSFLKKEHELWSNQSATEEATFPPALMFREPIGLDQYFADTEYLFDD